MYYIINIGDFYVSDINSEFHGTAGEANIVDYAGTVAIEIHKDATNDTEDEENHKLDLFSRICAYEDIIGIRFRFENDATLYDFRVNKKPCFTYISSLGHLYITLSNHLQLKSFFNFDIIEDKNKVSAHFRERKHING